MYEQDRKHVEVQHKRQMELMKARSAPMVYKLPDLHPHFSSEYYQQSFNEIEKMVDGTKEKSIKDAVFLVENAHFNYKLKNEDYSKGIKERVELIYKVMQQEGISENDMLAKNLMIYRFISDTLKLKDNIIEDTITHLPLKYDFVDYMGDEDWANMFVTKLLVKKSGQCHSLPLLYLILAEEMNTDAWLSFSPSHSYVKIKDGYGNLLNVELTNGMFTSDAWVVGSGFVKSEAIRNRIYLDTLSKDQTIAHMFFDLAQGYIHKFGYDDFVLKCANKCLEHYPNDIAALQEKANYYTTLSNYLLKQLSIKGVKEKSELHKYPKVIEVLKTTQDLHKTIEEMGFAEMPKEAYEEWLNSLDQERLKQEHSKQIIILNKSLF